MAKAKKLGPLSCKTAVLYGSTYYKINRRRELVAEVETAQHANLFRASPDLLEFVQQIFNGIDTGNITIDTPADETLANVLLRGRAALSKATGAA